MADRGERGAEGGDTAHAAPAPNAALRARTVLAARVAGLAVAGLGAVLLCGLAFDAGSSAAPPGYLSVQRDTAVCLIVLGASGWASAPGMPSRRRIAVAAGAVIVVVVCLLTFAVYALDRAGDTHPGRMPLNVALSMALLGGAHLALLARRGTRSVLVSQVCSLAVVLVGLLAILGYTFGAPDSERFRGMTGMALPSAVSVTVLGLATFLARPATGVARILTARGPSAMQTRRMLAAALLMPPVLGWLRVQGQDHGLFGTRVGGALLTAANMIVFAIVIVHAGSRAVRMEAAQLHAELLLAGRSQLQSLMDNLPAVVFMKDPEGRYVTINTEFERRFGVDRDYLIGRTADDVFPAPVAAEYRARDLQALAATEPIRYEDTVAGVGPPRTYLSAQFSLRDSAGRPYLVGGVATDITDWRAATEQVAQFFNLSLDLLVIAGVDGYFKRLNPSWSKALGYSVAELMEQPFMSFVHPDDVDRTVAEVDKLAAGDVTLAFENRYRCRDGSYRWIYWNCVPHLEEGLLYAVGRDVTERKLAEETVARARDEALALAQLKSQFVAMVSHEIRTPMNGVLGMTKLLVDTPLQPAQRRYVEAIRTSAQALLTVINDILDFSKVEARKITLVETDFDLHELLEAVTQVAAETAREKGIEILSFYPPELPREVRGDPGRLRQILLNLIGNAVKFTDHGEVVLRTDPASGDPGALRITFAVTDTGIGIAAADLERLFEPFAQLDASNTRQFGGTGLGLTISEQLLHLMGTRLDVESEPGRGSRFAFTVTLAHPQEQSRPTKPAKNALAGRRILLIDDSAASHQMLTAHAHAWGMYAAGAADAHSGLEHLRAEALRGLPYDVAVVDQSLPEIPGADLVRVIASDEVIPPTHLVLLTSGSHGDHLAVEASEASAILAKPIGPSLLYNCLLELLDPDIARHLSPPPGTPAAAPVERGTVLVAEDNEVNQAVAIETLALLGYQADLARDGVEAVALAGANSYLAILMDCQMPRMDGFAATAELRHREDPDHHTPVIAMTAGALVEDRERCLAAGMDDYLSKPIDFDELRDVLDRWTAEAARG